MEPIICLPDDPTRLLLRSCLYDERFHYPAAFLFFEHLNAIHLCTHSSSWHRLLCLPGSGGPTVACNTPSAPGGARHRSSDGGHRGDSVGRDSRQNKTLQDNECTWRTQTHLSDQSEGSVEAPGVGVLPDFVVEPAELGQSAAGVSQGLAQHHLVRHGTAHITYNTPTRHITHQSATTLKPLTSDAS